MNMTYKVIILALSLIPAISAIAQDIEWSAEAKADSEKILSVSWNESGGALSTSQRILFEKNMSALKSLFSTIDINDSKRTIKYRKGAALKGIARRTMSCGGYKEKTLKFVQNVLPGALGTGETLEVLYVEEDYGAEQQKDVITGEISPEVALKTYSYYVRIGRRLQQQPILNSIAYVEIDPATDEIVSFRFRNWEPVSYRQNKGSTRLTWPVIRDRVEARLGAQRAEAGTQITRFKIDQLLGGWVFDDESGEVVPAFVHYGIVYVNNITSGKNEEKRYAIC